jgi:hypothetical protein
MTALVKTSKAIKLAITPARTLADKLERADRLFRFAMERVQNEYIERCREAIAAAGTPDGTAVEAPAMTDAPQVPQQH